MPDSPQPNVSTSPHGTRISAQLWVLAGLAGVGSGFAAGLLMKLLRLVQHAAWTYSGGTFLDAVDKVGPTRRVLIPLSAGVLAACVLVLTGRSKTSHSNELEATIWLRGGRLAPGRTTIKAILSIVIVGLGASLGRESAPKQSGALIGSLLASWRGVPPSQRRLLAACGAGAGIAAVYNIPFGGALFTLEVLLGTLALPLVAPVFMATLLGTATGWLLLPNDATYHVPSMPITWSLTIWAALFAPLAGLASSAFVALIAFAAKHRPKGIRVVPVAIVVFAILGLLAIPFPQLLGNGKDAIELAALDQLALPMLLGLMMLKPLATAACLGTGAPGGLFTPTLTFGALLGGATGHLWQMVWPDAPAGAFALVGAVALLAGTTKGPISALVMMGELTHRIDGLMVPMLIAVAGAVTVAHRIDQRSIYTSRLGTPKEPRTCVYQAGLASPGAPIEAVSAASPYAKLLDICLNDESVASIYVVDDGGEVVGSIDRADVVRPTARFAPLEIATAVDFVRR